MNPFTPELSAELPGPAWLQAHRALATKAFQEVEMPNPDAEEWRYSPIEHFDFADWRPSLEKPGNAEELVAMLKSLVPDVMGLAICRDGWLLHAELSEELAAKGVKLRAAEEEQDLPRLIDGISSSSINSSSISSGSGEISSGSGEMPASEMPKPGDIFRQMCLAFSPGPVVLSVPSGIDVEGVILVIHDFTDEEGLATFPWLVVNLAENSSAAVLEITGLGGIGASGSEMSDSGESSSSKPSQSNGPSQFVAPLVELSVANSARLRYLNVQNLPRQTWQIASQVADVSSQANLISSTAALGGDYARLHTDCSLSGRGATGDIVALSFANESQTMDFRVFHSHIAPDTSSNLLFKGAIDDEARSIYTGLIRVGPDARGTNAFQTNRNLKLSDDAWAESVPNLEIENNDVTCSHASTVGPVEEEQLFYLQSRGVPTDVAERLIVDGFFAEVLDALPLQSAVPMVRQVLHEKLPYEFAE